MNIEEKSLALAELMGWKVSKQYGEQCLLMPTTEQLHMTICEPYSHTLHGLAQFAAILLKFPHVFNRFILTIDGWMKHALGPQGGKIYEPMEPTQENILDEILKMKGKWVK